MQKISFVFLFIGLFLISCNGESEKKPTRALPIYGSKDLIDGDTLYHTIGNFNFINQFNQSFTEENVDGKVYVADFFFTSCPVQCPKMSSQMKRLATNTTDIKDLMFVSHAIDYKKDSVPVLKDYIERNGLDFPNWFFLEAKNNYTSEIATMDYQVVTKEDVAAAGGYAHSAYFVLVDKSRRIRGYYDGQITEEVDRLERDIRKLNEVEYGVSSK